VQCRSWFLLFEEAELVYGMGGQYPFPITPSMEQTEDRLAAFSLKLSQSRRMVG
jgi:hypothetical protein